MKKNFVLILMSALLVFFAFTACGQTASDPDAPQSGIEGTVSSATLDTQDDQSAPDNSEEAAGKARERKIRLSRNLIKISNNPDRPIGGLDYFCKKIKKHLTI